MKNNMRKLLSFILCIVLIAAMALFAAGCSDKEKETPQVENGSTSATNLDATQATQTPAEVIEKGEGQTSFNFEVTGIDGKTTRFLVKTDKTIVGDALQDVGLITGDPGPYGLYVKSVNGITADYDKDGTYWAFYTNGAYATKGVDQTEIDTTATYSFVQTKG